MTEIIRMRGSRDNKIAAAKKIKAEFDSTFPELAELRRQLIERGMCDNNLSSVPRVFTENIDWNVTRDDPLHFHKKYQLQPIITEEIRHAVQARTSIKTLPANTVYDSRGGIRRR